MIDGKGRRCYNGCPDKELQAIIDESKRQDAVLKRFGAHATYYPMEERWMVWKNFDAVTDFKKSKSEAYYCAIKKLEGQNANIPPLS